MGKNRDDRNQNKGGGFQKPAEKGMPGQRQQPDRNLDKQKTPMGGGHGQQQQKQPFIKKEDSWKDKDK